MPREYRHIEQYEKPVLLTFDDGYDDNAETLLPLLQKYGMKATIFAIGVSFGTDHYKDTDYAITPHFGAAEAAEMTASGLISIQSHTYDMHQWPPYETGSAVRENILQLSSESEEAYVQALTEDFTRSRALLEDATGRPVDVLAYPAGQYSTLTQVTLQSLGVHVTLSTNPGVNTVVKGLPQTLYAMLRFGITEDISPEALLDQICVDRYAIGAAKPFFQEGGGNGKLFAEERNGELIRQMRLYVCLDFQQAVGYRTA